MSALEAIGIVKRFGATVALNGVDLTLRKGEVHALVGENGSGKSTLMNVFAGVLAPDSGAMSLQGEPFSPRGPFEARNAGVAMIHQELALCPDLTVAENIVLGMEATRMGWIDRARVESEAASALSALGRGDLPVGARVGELPIALRQIVEIARAVATGCDVLLFDEPTSSLSESDAEHLFEVIATLRDEGKAILYVSHFLEEVRLVADRITVLRDGVVAGEESAQADVETLVRLMAGRDIAEQFPRTARVPGDAILSFQDVRGVKLPQLASLTLRRGEVVGIAGLNGSGRTELLRAIFGLDPVRSGTVTVGTHVGPGSPVRRWTQGAGFLSEDRKEEGLALEMSLAENLSLSKLPLLVSPRRLEADAEDWLERAGVRRHGPGQRTGDLSGGNQQKVALARLLRHGVDVLLLDEPTKGIDVGSKQRLYALIDEAANEGKAVLVVSSYLPELFGICDRIAVMHRGRLGRPRPVGDWTADTMLKEATGS